MVEVRRIFSTPLAMEKMDASIDLAALRAAIEAEQQRDPQGIARSNVGGWHSAPTLQHWGGQAAKALANRVAAIADAMTLDTRTPDAGTHRWKADMWANVAAAGDARQYHFHPGCVWSAVAYLDDGYGGSTDPELGGELILLDPRMPQIRMNAPHLCLREADGGEQLVERPFQGSGTRISVALNLTAD
jgi:uncharacterized protein (TIGR02466 family)